MMGISIGQVKVDDKTNESKTIPDLLDLIDIEGCTNSRRGRDIFADSREDNIKSKKR